MKLLHPLLCTLVLGSALVAPAAHAAVHFSSFATLPRPGWSEPSSGNPTLVKDAAGNYYGTGSAGLDSQALVYRLSPAGEFTVLHLFTHEEALFLSPLVADGAGGFLGISMPSGVTAGSLFHIGSDGAYSVRKVLDAPVLTSYGPLMRASDGFYYGTAFDPAAAVRCIIRLSDAGQITLLAQMPPDEWGDPVNAMTEAADGSLFGAAYYHHHGETLVGPQVYRVTKTGQLSLVHQFEADLSWSPRAGAFALAADGTLYGAMERGGVKGLGGFFQFKADGSGWRLEECQNAAIPSAPVIGADGNPYAFVASPKFPPPSDVLQGTGGLVRLGADLSQTLVTVTWGNWGLSVTSLQSDAGGGFTAMSSNGSTRMTGGIYRGTVAAGFTALAEFEQPVDGNQPGKLAFAADGSIYGSRFYGNPDGRGDVFRFSAQGVYSRVGTLGDSSPVKVIVGQDGNLYGISQAVRTTDRNLLFKMTPAGVVTVLKEFTGSTPLTLFQASTGDLYGTALLQPGNKYQVFHATTGGDFEILRTFTDDGRIHSLAYRNDGYLWGTCDGIHNNGQIFRMQGHAAADGGFTLFYAFTGQGNSAVITVAGDGGIYGLRDQSSISGQSWGYFFRFQPEANSADLLTPLHYFDEGESPQAPELVEGSDGRFYGASGSGGDFGQGYLFSCGKTGEFHRLYQFDGAEYSPENIAAGPDGNVYGDIPRTVVDGGSGDRFFRLHVDDSPSSFDLWLQANGLSSADGDDDHDGLSNLMEYALGTDPHAPTGPATGGATPGSLAFQFSAGNEPVVYYSRSVEARAAGVRLVPECSVDLVTWTMLSPFYSATPVMATGDQVEMIQPDMSLIYGPGYFFRLRVETP